VVREVLQRRELHALRLIIDGFPLGRPPRRNPSPEVGERLFGNIDVKWPDGWIGVPGRRVGAHDPYPFPRVEGDSVDGLPACGHSSTPS